MARHIGKLSNAVFARTVRLSIEGVGIDDIIAGLNYMITEGAQLFSFSVHSSSFQPFGNPYSREQQDIDKMLKNFECLLRYTTSSPQRMQLVNLNHLGLHHPPLA